VLLAAAVSLSCDPTNDTLALPAPTEIPLELETSSDGSLRMFVMVQIGDAPPIQALFDTGSSGLRVLSSAVPLSAFTTVTTTAVGYAYGDYDFVAGITGVVAYASVTLGDLVTEEPIAVMLVDGEGCNEFGADCAIMPTAFIHAPAILGVGMKTYASSEGIGNPIAQLPGAPPYVVHLPDAPMTGTGVLRIGREPTDDIAFRTLGLGSLGQGVDLANGTPAWNDSGIPCCVSNAQGGQTYCMSSIWDTGAPVATLAWPSQPAPLTTELSPGSAVSVTVGDATAPVASFAFVVGAEPMAGVDLLFVEPPLGGGSINLGITLFERFDAYFDQRRGVVGLAER
jgi:Protein of unknown function (DUF3443)